MTATADPTLKQILRVLLAALIVGALYLGREFLIPLTLAVILAFVLAPLVDALNRARLPHSIAVFAAVLLSLAVVATVGLLIGSQVKALAEDAPQYQGALQSKFGDVGTYATNELASLTARFGLRPDTSARPARPAAKRAATLTVAGGPNPIPVQIYQPPPKPWQLVSQIVRPVLAPLATLALVFVLAIFILLQQSDLRDRLIRLVGSSDLHRTTIALDEAASRLGRYFLSQLAVNAAFGATIAVGLHLIGVPHAVLFGAISSVARYIPYVGIFVSAGLAGVMAAAIDPGWSLVIWTLALFGAADTLTGQVVEPMFYGHSTGLTPMSVILSAVFWTWLWGPIGLVLSTPLSLCLLVLGRHVPELGFIDVVLGDRPALNDVEICYQRLLGGHDSEATQQALDLLKTRSLSAYYDEVLLQALLLAASDEHFGSLSREQLLTLGATAEKVVESLASRPDVEPQSQRPGRWSRLLRRKADSPAPRRPPQPEQQPLSRELSILCISGPEPLDDVASAMLSQILQKQGFKAIVARFDAAGPQKLSELDIKGYALVAVATLQVRAVSQKLSRLVTRVAGSAQPRSMLLMSYSAADRSAEHRKIAANVLTATNIRAAVDLCLVAEIEPANDHTRRMTGGEPQRTS